MIHPTAIVEDGVTLGSDVSVGAYTHIRSGAKIGNGTRIHSHVCIWGETEMGEENEIYPFCSIGAPPQIPGDAALKSRVIIGNKNVLREAVEVHRASSREQGITKLGDENYIMTSVHIAHDCILGNKIIIATKTGIAGHAKIDDSAIISGACGIAQFVRIGSYTYCAGMTRFIKDLPPYFCAKEWSEVTGPNLVGLKRAGYTSDDLRVIKEIYKAVFLNKDILKNQMQNLNERFAGNPVFEKFETFVKGSKLGIMRNS